MTPVTTIAPPDGASRVQTCAVLATWLAVPNPYLLAIGAIAGSYVLWKTKWTLPRKASVTFVAASVIVMVACSVIVGGVPPLSRGIPLLLASVMVAFFLQNQNNSLSSFFRGSLIAGLFYISATLMSVVNSVLLPNLMLTGLNLQTYNYVAKESLTQTNRYGAFGLDPNLSSAILLLTVCVCVATRKYWPVGRLYALLLLAAPVAIVLTASRMTLVVGLTVYVWFAVRAYGTKTLWIAAAMLPVALAVPTEKIPALQKVAGSDVGLLQSDNLRYFLWDHGLQQLLKARLFGVGWGLSDQLNTHAVGRPITFHSTWLTVLLDFGILGGFLCIGLSILCLCRLIMQLGLVSVPLVFAFIVVNTYITFAYAIGPFAVPLLLGFCVGTTVHWVCGPSSASLRNVRSSGNVRR